MKIWKRGKYNEWQKEPRIRRNYVIRKPENKYPDDYAPEVLETFENKHPENDYFVKFNAPEFTSLCPITGQPDFATIYISYVPGERMVESKSLKLYLYSFRNHGDFHEERVRIFIYWWLLSCCLSDNVKGKFGKVYPRKPAIPILSVNSAAALFV